MRYKLSDDVNLIIGFVSGIIFSNAIGALLQGQVVVATLSFLAVAVAVSLKKFVDWGIRE